MTVDEFLAWADGREGRWELRDGAPVAMSPERAIHGETKFSATTAFKAGIKKAGIPCKAFVNSLAVRIDRRTTFQPDVVVNCGDRLAPDMMEAPNAIVVVEILSPSARAVDTLRKVRRYFELASIHHYLILDPDDRTAIHYARGEGDVLLTRIVTGGALRFDPPGFSVEARALFPEPYQE